LLSQRPLRLDRHKTLLAKNLIKLDLIRGQHFDCLFHVSLELKLLNVKLLKFTDQGVFRWFCLDNILNNVDVIDLLKLERRLRLLDGLPWRGFFDFLRLVGFMELLTRLVADEFKLLCALLGLRLLLGFVEHLTYPCKVELVVCAFHD
jgi:hypothetical protein